MKIRADRRRRHVDPDPERVRRAYDVATDYRVAKLRMAKVLVEIEAGGDHLLRGYSSVRDFATAELQLPGVDVPMLLELGRSLPLAAGTRDGSGDGSGGAGTNAATSATPTDASSAEPDAATADGAPDGTARDDAAFADAAHDDDAHDDDAATSEHGTAPLPTVEDRVTSGALSMENASQIHRLWRALGDVPEHDRRRWMRAAEEMSAYKFRQMVRRAVEEAAQAERTVHLPLQVTESARDEFRRAKNLASRRARRLLTDGQVFAVIVRSYLATEDERRVGEKKRRVGSTKLLPGKRYVPAAVVRAIRVRARDRCEVPGCSNGGFLELMHVATRHADGGGREVDDLALGCSTHHVLLDAGVVRFAGWGEDGQPRFRTADGRVMGQPLALSDDGSTPPRDHDRCSRSATPSANRRARAPP